VSRSSAAAARPGLCAPLPGIEGGAFVDDRILKQGDTALIELSTPWRSSGLLGELPRPLCPVGTFLVPDLDRPFRHP